MSPVTLRKVPAPFGRVQYGVGSSGEDLGRYEDAVASGVGDGAIAHVEWLVGAGERFRPALSQIQRCQHQAQLARVGAVRRRAGLDGLEQLAAALPVHRTAVV